MQDPGLPPECFLRDRVFSGVEIIRADEWIGPGHSPLDGTAGSFRSVGPIRLAASPRGQDLSPYNSFSLPVLNLSESTVLVGMQFIHGGEEFAPGVPASSVTGGREEVRPGRRCVVRFPLEAFGTYGSPDGRARIAEIGVTFGTDRNVEHTEPLEVEVGPLTGEYREIPSGPRLTRQGLLSVVDDSAADGRLWDLYRPQDPGFAIPAPHSCPRDEADLILRGIIMGQDLGHPIPWQANPLGVLEWAHFLHRHHFLRTLVAAAAQTGEDRYTRAVDETVAHWISSNPVTVDSNGGAGPSWETLSVAWRLREWLWTAGTLWPHPSFREETKLLMLASIWEHARSLMDHRGHPNNWIIVESAALTLAGLAFPQFRESEKWLQTGIARLCEECRRQSFSDGVHYEISPLYHAICLHALLDVRRALGAKGIPVPEEFREPLERSFDYLTALCRPDFTWPALNDSGGAAGDYTALMLLAGEVFKRKDLLWIGSRGARGTKPAQGSWSFPDAGISVMRSSYDRAGHVLVFRGGPPGAFHVHDDALSLDVVASGIPRLADPGVTSYAPYAMTNHYRSAEAHNVVLIDGRGPERRALPFADRIRPAGNDFAFTSSGELEIATGRCKGPWKDQTGTLQPIGRYVHVRTVIFVRKSYWILRDLFFGDSEEEHEIATCRQFFPGRVDIDIKTLTAHCHEAHGPSFEFLPVPGGFPMLVEVFTGSSDPPRGWVSLAGRDLPAHAFRYCSLVSFPAVMLWLLVPVPQGRRSGVNAVQEDLGGGKVTLTIAWPSGATDRIALAAPGPEDLAVGGEKLHGEVTFLARQD